MKEFELTVSDIKDIMNTFSKNKLGSLKIKQDNFCLELEGPKTEQLIAAPVAAPVMLQATAAASQEAEEPAPSGNVVKSPIVGTFYASPAPDKDPYVKPGQQVKRGDVLFIIESMKLMNEVTSEVEGTIGEVLVKNAQAVEYGQPILTIE